MIEFSANLGFLWTDRPLPDAILAAKNAGFDAVECHWPYEVAVAGVNSALAETGLKMLGLNTSRGDVSNGDNGLSAIPGREPEARAAIDEAIDYASQIACPNIHVMAGFAEGEPALKTFMDNLVYASEKAQEHNKTILIEPLNAFDAPGYFLNTTDQAAEIIAELSLPNIRLMFDCYHVGRTEGNVVECLHRHFPITGHIQFASVPDRGPPDHGDVDYQKVFGEVVALGWKTPLGAEYKPVGDTDDTLDWMNQLRG